MKKIRMMMAAALAILASCSTTKSGESTANPLSSKVIVAYVTSWSNIVPEPQYMTHINYAFGHVNESFDGVRIDNEERLKQIVDLKKQNPELKVLLSVGGWGSGRFSEMAANDEYRRGFAKDWNLIWMASISIGNIPRVQLRTFQLHPMTRRTLHF